MQHEARKTIAVIGAFVILLYVTFGIFTLLTPLPEHPEIIRARAKILIQESETQQQFAWIRQVIYAGISILVAGVLIVSGSLWLLGRVLRSQGCVPSPVPRHQLRGHQL